MGGEPVTTDNGDGQKVRIGWEEKAANVLNAVMVMAIGLAIGALGVWVLWRFAVAVRTSGFGPDTPWMDLFYPAMLGLMGVQIFRLAARRRRAKQT